MLKGKMKSTTMLEIAIDFVSEDYNQSYEFYEIFERVESLLKDSWIEKFVNTENGKDYEKVRELKMGELYRLLTVDKEFSRNMDGTWKKRLIN